MTFLTAFLGELLCALLGRRLPGRAFLDRLFRTNLLRSAVVMPIRGRLCPAILPIPENPMARRESCYIKVCSPHDVHIADPSILGV